MVGVPLVVKTRSQLPVPKVAGAEQPAEPLAVTVTVPVGVPPPAAVADKVHCTVTVSPTMEGSG